MDNKIGLQIDTSLSQDKSNNKIGSSKDNALSYSSIEIKASRAVFKKDGFTVDGQCIKKIDTNEILTKVINPEDLEVKLYILLLILILILIIIKILR